MMLRRLRKLEPLSGERAVILHLRRWHSNALKLGKVVAFSLQMGGRAQGPKQVVRSLSTKVGLGSCSRSTALQPLRTMCRYVVRTCSIRATRIKDVRTYFVHAPGTSQDSINIYDSFIVRARRPHKPKTHATPPAPHTPYVFWRLVTPRAPIEHRDLCVPPFSAPSGDRRCYQCRKPSPR